MRIFLTGATGYLGAAILDGFARAGHSVIGLARNSEKAADVVRLGGTPLLGDLHDPAGYASTAASCEVIVHAASDGAKVVEGDLLAIETLIGAARSASPNARTFIYTSGIWLLGPTSEPAIESSPVNPPAVAAHRPAHEQMVLSAAGEGLRTVVVRPGIVYGGSRGIVGDIFRDAANGLVRIIGPGDNRWPVVYDRDLADLYVRLAQRPDASGIYHATDESDDRVNDIVEAIVAYAPVPPSVRRVPVEEAKTKLGPYAAAMALDQVVNSPRARALGWVPALHSVARNAARLFEEWRAGHRVAAGD
jgi:nucleoside-diphosphate-sugar epimerase